MLARVTDHFKFIFACVGIDCHFLSGSKLRPLDQVHTSRESAVAAAAADRKSLVLLTVGADMIQAEMVVREEFRHQVSEGESSGLSEPEFLQMKDIHVDSTQSLMNTVQHIVWGSMASAELRWAMDNCAVRSWPTVLLAVRGLDLGRYYGAPIPQSLRPFSLLWRPMPGIS